MRKIRVFLPYLLLLIIIVALFKDLPKTFYQQDEWLGLGNILIYGRSYLFLGSSNLLQFFLGEGRFASRVLTYFLFGHFPFNITPTVTFALIFHSLNTFLVYRLLKNFFQDFKYSFLGASFFAVNAVAHQAVTWPAAVVGTLSSTTLILFSLFAYFKAIGDYNFENNKFLNNKWLLISFGLLYVSFHFKGTGIFLLLFSPLVTLLLKRKLFYSKLKVFLSLFLTFFVVIFLYRVVQLKLKTEEVSVYLSGLSENFFLTMLVRTIFYPLTSFSLMFVPEEYFLPFARFFLDLHYPFLAFNNIDMLIAQTVVLDMLAIILAVLLFVFFYILSLKEKRKVRGAVIFWVIFILMSFLPYVVLKKNYAYFESRYYYVPLIGGAFLFSFVLKRLVKLTGRRLAVGIVALAVFYLLLHAGLVKRAISEQVAVASLRKNFITRLKKIVPTLEGKRNIFYITSNQDFYFEGNKVPFQQGTGYTLMVLYHSSGKIPTRLMQEEFLFDLGSQGYREVGNYGFGYFWDEGELKRTIKERGLENYSLIRLFYDVNQQKVIKIKKS